MSFTALLNRTGTLIPLSQVGIRDRGGNQTWEEGETEDVPCRIYQTAVEEVTVGRTTATSTHRGLWPAGTVFDSSDRWEVDGVVYEVLGPPAQIFGFADEHHVEAKLRVVATGGS